MVWAHFYLICFAAGFIFSLVSFLVGNLHWHFPHVGAHGHAGPPVHTGHPAAHGPHAAAKSKGFDISYLNPTTIAAFLTWFGATGYLLSRYSTFWFVIGLAIASLSGLAGAGIVYLFLTRVLKSKNLDAADYEMTGVLGRISVPIREGGTGEIIYSQAGTRRTCGARSEKATMIPKGSEVIVTRYEKGIAYVRLWNEMTGDEPDSKDVVSIKSVNSTEKETN